MYVLQHVSFFQWDLGYSKPMYVQRVSFFQWDLWGYSKPMCICTRSMRDSEYDHDFSSLVVKSTVRDDDLVCRPWELESVAEQDTEVSIVYKLNIAELSPVAYTIPCLPPDTRELHTRTPCPRAHNHMHTTQSDVYTI